MEIDLFTLIAQIINFLILVVLLRHFLYKRIIDAMDEREKRISSRLEEAFQKKKEAEEEAESYRKKKQEHESKREEMFAKAKDEVQTYHIELTQKARNEVMDSKTRWYEEIERQKTAFLNDLRSRAGERIYTIARRALHDLANEELELHIINTFIKRLEKMSEEEKKAIQGFIHEQHQEIVIKSAFDIPEIMHQVIKEAVRDQIGFDAGFRFETVPDIICGIELHARDRKITWSLGSYLDTLEEDISRVFEQKGAAG